MQIETERKFLIRLPDTAVLTSLPGIRIRGIVQTYLAAEDSTERRIRSITENGHVSYIYTEKRPIPGTKISRYEDEKEITEAEYNQLMREAVTELAKTRYAFPYKNHTIEIDVYPYEIGGEDLAGKAVLEVELAEADEEFSFPAWTDVLKELTGTREFSNKALAKPKHAE